MCNVPDSHPLQGESTMAEGPLQGKVAMITGAASPIGLGYAMTVALVRAGARVALLDIHDAWLAQSAAEMRTLGGEDCALPSVSISPTLRRRNRPSARPLQHSVGCTS